MAWQSPSAMNAGGANGGGDGNAPAGTEYTLQGTPHLARAPGDDVGTGCRLTLAQELCASSSSSGTTTSGPETPGTLSALR